MTAVWGAVVADQTPWVLVAVGILTALGLALGLFAMARMGWRIFHGNDPMEPGGSWGDQLSRRDRTDGR